MHWSPIVIRMRVPKAPMDGSKNVFLVGQLTTWRNFPVHTLYFAAVPISRPQMKWIFDISILEYEFILNFKIQFLFKIT